MRNSGIALVAMTSAVLSSIVNPGTSSAAEMVVTGVSHFLDNRSANSINLPTGIRQQFGADVVPSEGTTGTATQGSFVGIDLNFIPLDTNPNQFNRSLPADTAPDGAWTLNFFNGPDHATVTTRDIAGASVMPFVSAMKISGTGAAPTFTWQLPAAAPVDAVRVRIRDVTQRVGSGGIGGDGVGNTIYSTTLPGTSPTSFTVDPTDPGFTQSLLVGHQYSFEVQLRDLRNNAGGSGGGNTLSQSRSFFDFTLLASGAPADVYLPMVNPDAPGGLVYEFQPIPVVTGETIFIDPFVATGYDYQKGGADPNFASVTLPTGIGDNQYEVLIWNGTTYVVTATVTGGEEFKFAGPDGVDRFRVTGIETSAAIDPLEGTAFITGLSFVGGGTFAGTMTPLTTFVPGVPEPSTYVLMLASLGLVGFVARRRRRT